MNNGYQPKKKGDGKPPSPPTTGSKIQTPEHNINVKIETAIEKFPPSPPPSDSAIQTPLICDEILKSMKIELDDKTKKEFILAFYDILYSTIEEVLINGKRISEEYGMTAKKVFEEFKK